MQEVICINVRNLFQNQIEVGKTYYLETSSVYGDSDGDWYGKIYADKDKEKYIGDLKLSHFKSNV